MERPGPRHGALRTAWTEGRTALGAWLSLRDPLVAEVVSTAGYDYVVVDMQHGLADYEACTRLLSSMVAGGSTPVVRVPWNEPGIIGRVLDAGALGVIVPMVNSPEEAEAAVAACRYAPEGRRSFGPTVAATRYGAGYIASANRDVACIPMIETLTALERIDEILAVPGIDAVYVGPADLSLTLGLPPRADHSGTAHAAVFDDALARIAAACVRHGVVPGIHASAGLAAARHATGFRMITVGFDLSSIGAAVAADLATARGATA